MRFFKVVAKAAVSFYEELFFFFLTGLIYVIGFILIIPGPFALAGIYRISQRAVRGKAVKWRIVWQGVKEFGLRTFLIFVLIVLGFVLLLTNLWFYNSPEISPFAADVGVWVTPLWILLILLWSGVAFYATAFLFELEEPKTFMVLRNSLFLTVLRPIQTLLFLIVSVLALVVSVALPILLTVSPAFIATLSVTAVRTLVTDLKEQAEQRQAGEQGAEGEEDGEE
jgi:uncharacterized membrane protein YesL